MKVLVVGGGGREHTLVWKIAQSSRVSKVYCAPGNAGTADIATNLPVSDNDIPALLGFARDNNIGLTVVGPEVPLVAGIVDEFEAAGLRIFGPNARAAILEGSKVFTKELLYKYDIPTAEYHRFTDASKAVEYLESNTTYPIVIKADGLAAGKGVLISLSREEAQQGVREMMEEKVFGMAGDEIIIEEFMTGPELSMLCFVDSNSVVPMVSAKDYKRIGEDDTGLNTGGMGAISPNPLYDDELEAHCLENIIEPTLRGMRKEGRPFKGILYCGIMLTEAGPKVLEYNVRFGDPETQVILPRLETDLLDIFEAVIDDKLSDLQVKWDQTAAATVVLASQGYPEAYPKGLVISGLDQVNASVVFHAGTAEKEGEIVTSGGRVLTITTRAATVASALTTSYQNADLIHFEGKTIRMDIGS
ncbi:MAG: phosphoribosylamine--glycine ligase [Candidatus Marinimicrobia bacterium]|nr:phosphoribosylamine--glycine ligase [Candidatus Neomarinimicrobiota bacterium]MBT4360280.1 phosphoribosylamine--glycine ligase [Candidatus Neomarinimicrobiota bacterium]MBT4715626.1 phosphoribosylamine--glycine ligase [Candidatus Neomarinimicrobiota bacterium]MBT4945475.1 phosphoribosylamine--glycine ligase [Candidatus Neomarinimicrobiota bacterium]MBT5270285.1 phosphoribosylamine--glycine ligase [Candidatus Neomarinimicrobiota bacterium]